MNTLLLLLVILERDFITHFCFLLLTHHLHEQTVISHFPFLRGNVNKTKYKVYAKIRCDPISR